MTNTPAYESEYWTTGKDLAIESLGIRDKLMKAPQVREWIAAKVKPEGLLYTQVADFWLRIKKADGHARRRELDPPNPFIYRGKNNAYQGRRDRIEEWHRAWIQRIGVQAQVDELEGKQDPVSHSLLKDLQQQHPWLVMITSKPKRGYTKSIVGWALGLTPGLMDQAYSNPEDLALEHFTLDEALRRPWFDRDERGMWLKILERVQQYALEELGQTFDRQYAELARLALADHEVERRGGETAQPDCTETQSPKIGL